MQDEIDYLNPFEKCIPLFPDPYEKCFPLDHYDKADDESEKINHGADIDAGAKTNKETKGGQMETKKP